MKIISLLNIGIFTLLSLTACSNNKLLNSDQKEDFQTVYMEIAPKLKPCSGEGITECLQVRDIEKDQNGTLIVKNVEWENFYDGIEGYQHKKNEKVILKLKKFNITEPLADGSSSRYVFDGYVIRLPNEDKSEN